MKKNSLLAVFNQTQKKTEIKARYFVTALFFIFIQTAFGQNTSTIYEEISSCFNEVKIETAKHQQLWGKDLYGPILLVDPNTRELYANFSDTEGALKPAGEIFTGVLPKEINIANTAVNWSGRRWAMIILPLPTDKSDKINLLAHELFHVSQPSLGFQLFNVENNHLDQREGRIYLRLELEALKKGVQSTDQAEQKQVLTNAMIFRKYRCSLYPGAEQSENLLELNEGIAEYTGMMISGRDEAEAVKYFVGSINGFLNNPTFVRSFAYQTTPVYGYLLEKIKPGWNREITVKTNLTDYFINAFALSIPTDLKKATGLILDKYDGEKIISEETQREEKTKQLIILLKNKFITQPHLVLNFEQMNVSFNPGNIMPLEDKGTVYPNIRVTDNWGILTVEHGALMSPNWDKISVSAPVTNEKNKISGDGWTLELKEGYSVIKDENSGNYKLIKK